VKTAISLPDKTFARVDEAAQRLGMSRSEFFARAAERWLDSLDDDGTTAQINRSLQDGEEDTSFVRAAAYKLAQSDDWQW
jgi:predicted DNA-binding protein